MRLRVGILVSIVVLLVLPPLMMQFTSPIRASPNQPGENEPPIASFTYDPAIPMPEETITFNASGSYDPDGAIVRYTWDFGDGNVAAVSSPTVTHSYPIDGSYTVGLTVTDDSGSTGTSAAVIEVSTVVYFRVVYIGSLSPMSNVSVTVYYNNGSAWVPAPVGSTKAEIKYDLITQPNYASTSAQKYRNPGYTASILLYNASNIGFDLHQESWTVFFKFEWGPYVSYWPNDTTRVYSYYKGSVETHDYYSGHKAYWNAAASTYVISVKDIPRSGVCPTECHPIIVSNCPWPPPPTNYYLTVRTDPASITTIPGEGWYVKNTNTTLNAPTYVNISTTTRYRFNYWDVDGTSRGIGVNPIPVNMTANHTATARYILQYSAVFNQTGISSDATGTIATVNGTSVGFTQLPYTMWVDCGGSVTYSYNSTVSSSITGKKYILNNISGPSSPITVSSPASVTGNYVTQYLVTFAQSGLDSTATGTVVTINGSAKTFSLLPNTTWVGSGSSITYSYMSIVSSSVSGKQFRLGSVSGPSSPITVSGPTTITGNYVTQYLVTFAQSGLDSTASGTIVTVNGTAKIFSELSYSTWVDNGSSITYLYTSTVPSSVSGKQFRLNSVTGSSSPITVTGPTTITGNYVAQYLVTFAQSGLDASATGTVVTVNGSAKTYSLLPNATWVDSGSTMTYSYSSTISSSTPNKQFRLGSVNCPSSPISVTAPTTVTGYYVIQYFITFTQTGLDPTAAGTVVTVNGSAKAYDNLPYAFWADNGSLLTHSYTSIVSSNVSGKQFRLGSVSGPSSPITVSGPTTITGNYVTQYLITFAQSGLDSTATGTVVTINGSAKTYSALPNTTWVDSGSSLAYSYNNVSSSTAGKQFILTGVTGSSSPITVTSSASVTGNYKIQYRIIFEQTGVGSDFQGTVVTIDSVNYNFSRLPTDPFWWNESSNHTFVFVSPLTVNSSQQYIWNSTSGLSSLQAGTLTVTTSGSITGNYVIQNCVTFDITGASSDFNGTVLIVDGTPYNISLLSKSFCWQIGSVHNFSFQSPLIVTVNVKQYVWISTTGLTNLQNGSITVTTFGNIIGNYKAQYYLNLATNPPGVNNPSGTGWYDSGTYANMSTQQCVYGGSRYCFINWTTADMSEIADPLSPNTTVLIDKAKTVTANYVHQYIVTFAQSGLSSDAVGTVVTVNGTAKTYADLPNGTWVDEGGIINYSYETVVSSTATGKQFNLTGVTGSSSPITVTADTNITGNYKTQYYLTVSSLYSTTGGQGWYDNGTTAYATLNAGIVDHGNGTRRVFTNWNGDATGTNYAQSNPMTMSAAKTATANWKTQYNATFAQLGLDSSASSTVVTINSSAKTYSMLPNTTWVDSGSSITYSFNNVSSSTPGKQFILIGVTGLPSPITVTGPQSITGNYRIQYMITFNQTGIGNDFTGTIITIDGTNYNYSTISASFWWDNGSAHTFAFASPLVVNISKQYNWASTTGLSAQQNETLTITGSGNVTGNYVAQGKYQITFDQSGVVSDFQGTVVTIDSINYNVTALSASFWWDAGSVHNFTYQSPLTVNASINRYAWVNTTGLSTSQNGSITVTTSGTVTGNYKPQFYLTLTTNPPGVDSPSGSGWYDANTSAAISTDGFVDIVPGSSRYRFDGWQTADMAEIANSTVTPTTVLMDKGKTVTANYAIQYKIIFNQSGVVSDFTGTIVNVDGRDYNFTGLPTPFWWDNGSIHSFSFASPLVVTANAKQYVWTNTTGITTLQTGFITVTTSGSATGNYRTQYYLTVNSSYDSPTPTTGWCDAGNIVASVTSPSSGPAGTRYVCTGWSGTGSVPSSGSSSTATFTIVQASSITWNWKTQYLLTVQTNPVGLGSQPTRNPSGEAGPPSGWWYDTSTNVTLTAQSASGYAFSNWDVDGSSKGNGVNPIAVVMGAPHTATAHYSATAPQLSVTINPLSTTIHLNQSVAFTSTVNGGTQPYSYQWYLAGNPYPGATSSGWAFTPTADGVYYIFLKVTDANNNTVQSATARVVVTSVPVGGYSVPLVTQPPTNPATAYFALITLFGIALSLMKRKRK
jgi:hypothetical protein